jgi:hypothetical protein
LGFSDVENRYILPALPFFVISSAYFLCWLIDKFPWTGYRKLILAILIFLISGYSIYLSALYTAKLQKPDTRMQAVNWIYQNIPSGQKIILDIPYIYLNESKKSIEALKENNSFWLDSRRRYLLGLAEEVYPRPNYFILDLNRLDLDKIDLQQFKADYYVYRYWNGRERERAGTTSFKGRLAAKFYPQEKITDLPNLLNEPSHPLSVLRSINYLGPYVEIWKINP